MPNFRKSTTEYFVNPYNFIRISNEERVKTNNDNLPKYSGVVHCNLLVKTPLAIPEFKNKNGDHPCYGFMMDCENNPMIPGSSIRGPIRTMYETLTGSCFVTLPNEYSITRRTEANNPFAPALLIKEDENWILYKADKYRLKIGRNGFSEEVRNDERVIAFNGKKYRLGDQVRFTKKGMDVTSISYEIQEDYLLSGYIYVGEPIFSKRSEGVFVKGSKIDKFDQNDIERALNGLKSTISVYRNGSINRNLSSDKKEKNIKDHLGYRGFEHALNNGVLPLYYKDDGQIYLSIAAIGRKAYRTTVNELVGERYDPCKTLDVSCPACDLFGMAKEDARGTKIRFTDANVRKKIDKNSVCLKELGTPRIGYLPFYSVNGMSYDESGANISGRKFYWHNPQAALSDEPYKDTEGTGRYSTMDLMDVGSEFFFDVYFDGITDFQLRELEWVLTLGENTRESNRCHKIGHGKPIGLGSVKITIEGIEKREYSDNSYTMVSEDIVLEEKPERFQEDILSQIKIAADFNSIGGDIKISYPFVKLADGVTLDESRVLKENVLASHQWFSENKRPIQSQMLKAVFEGNDQSLSIYEKTDIRDNDYEKPKITTFKKGEEYSGIVTGYNPKKTIAKIKLDNGEMASVHFKKIKYAEYGKIDRKLKMKDTVIVRYDGKDNNGYDQWTVV